MGFQGQHEVHETQKKRERGDGKEEEKVLVGFLLLLLFYGPGLMVTSSMGSEWYFILE